jgi:D-alanyl-lipoteichoic acid acyltransferase DltB (MBOAT superfamily)
METFSTFIAENLVESVLVAALFYIVYVSLRQRFEIQNLLLLLAGYAIYGAVQPAFLGLLVAITAISYFAGFYLAKQNRYRGFVLYGSILSFLAVLAFFRYFTLLSDSLGPIFSGSVTLGTVIPLGISFYVLQAISYLVDVAGGKFQPARNFAHLALYLSFIFKLPAGPIERPGPFLTQISSERRVTAEHWNAGLWLIVLGLLEKKVMADNLAPIANQVFSDPAGHAGIDIVLGVIAFAFQLYGDFSGYSNIGRGLAKLFGFELMINFKLPYFAGSPNDFWARWHISLSTWLREYVFFPARRWFARRNLKGAASVVVPTVLSMVASGLWHGAGLTFVIWGLYFAALSVAYYYLDKAPGLRRSKLASVAIAIFRTGLMFGLVCTGWLIFRSESLANLGAMVANIGFGMGSQSYGFIADIVFFVGPILAINLFQAYTQDLMVIARWPTWVKAPIYAFTLCWILLFSAPEGVEFIYARF